MYCFQVYANNPFLKLSLTLLAHSHSPAQSCWKLKSQAFLRCFGQNTSLHSTSQKSVKSTAATATATSSLCTDWSWEKREKSWNLSGHSGRGRNWYIQMNYEISWRNHSRKSSRRAGIRKYYFLTGQAVSGSAINITFWSWLWLRERRRGQSALHQHSSPSSTEYNGYEEMGFPSKRWGCPPSHPKCCRGALLLPFKGRIGWEWGQGSSQGQLLPSLPTQPYAVPLPGFTAKVKGHFPRWLPGLESTEVSKATVSQTTSQKWCGFVSKRKHAHTRQAAQVLLQLEDSTAAIQTPPHPFSSPPFGWRRQHV